MDIRNELVKLLNTQIANDKAKLYLNILNFVLWIILIVLCVVWYDFKLFLILWVALFANNLQRYIDTKYK